MAIATSRQVSWNPTVDPVTRKVYYRNSVTGQISASPTGSNPLPASAQPSTLFSKESIPAPTQAPTAAAPTPVPTVAPSAPPPQQNSGQGIPTVSPRVNPAPNPFVPTPQIIAPPTQSPGLPDLSALLPTPPPTQSPVAPPPPPPANSPLPLSQIPNGPTPVPITPPGQNQPTNFPLSYTPPAQPTDPSLIQSPSTNIFPPSTGGPSEIPNAFYAQQQYQQQLTNDLISQLPSLISQEQSAQNQQAQTAMGQSQALTSQEQQMLPQLLNQQLGDAETNLTTGAQGTALRDYYNSQGLLNSGAFSEGLAAQLAPIIQQNNQLGTQIGLGGMQNQQDILNALYGTNSGLGVTGLNQILGDQQSGTQNLSDLGLSGLSATVGATNSSAANAIAQAIAQNQQKQQQDSGIGSLLGTGIGGLAGFFGTGGNPMGALIGSQLGSSAGGSLGSLFG